MSIRDQDIMVLHPTIPNPMVIPDQAMVTVHRPTIPSLMVIQDQVIVTVHRPTIPNPMVIPDQAIVAVHRHTIRSPMVIQGPVGKWCTVISPVRHRMVQTAPRCLEPYLDTMGVGNSTDATTAKVEAVMGIVDIGIAVSFPPLAVMIG
jgi:hypothetical protein